MNTATLQAMQAGRQAAAERRAREHQAAQTAYLGWVKDESLAYHRVLLARDFAGEASQAARDAYSLWQGTLRAMPKPPPDHAWVDR